MGYRSEIAIVLHKDLANDFQSFIEKDSDVKHVINVADINKVSEEGDLFLLWEEIKWYDEGTEKIDELITTFINSNDLYDKVLMIRIGESLDDMEVLGTYFDNSFGVNYIRSITWSCDYLGDI